MRLDYKGPLIDVKNFMYQESRFKMMEKLDERKAKEYLQSAREYAQTLYRRYLNLEQMSAKTEEI